MDSHQPMWQPLEWPVERARVHVETARCWLCVAQSCSQSAGGTCIFLPSSNITAQLHALAHTEDVPWLAE
jgi:hypothetical protein